MTCHKIYPLLQPLETSLEPAELCALLSHDRHPFFLDSGGVGGRLGRYSFLGSDPFLIFRHYRGKNEIIHENCTQVADGNPFDILKTIFSQYHLITPPDAPPFLGGAVGYFAYDLKHFIEKFPPPVPGNGDIPLCFLAFYDTIIIYDHLKNKSFIALTGLPEENESFRLLRAKSRLEEFRRKLSASPAPFIPDVQTEVRPTLSEVTCNFTRDEYLKAILRAKEYIAAGDIYQVNLSRKFSVPLHAAPFQLYRTLRRLNPAPFASFFDMGDAALISSSPERFLRIAGRTVETRPIKGTRPRGKDTTEDARLKAELMESAKDRAELMMIVDLERNDLGRVCDYGSVSVPELVTLEEYATVFHLVATVTGRLRLENDHLDCIRAAFPGGSITGAPKIRAMEIIDELEHGYRGIYTGSHGYIGFNRQTDLNILIRTMLHTRGAIHFQVGGGIVADSDPALEYEETMHKGKALLDALRCAGVAPFTAAAGASSNSDGSPPQPFLC